jgi:hypothetical protein
MKRYNNTSKWLNERTLFKGMPYHQDPKKADLQKRREQVALDKQHREHCESLYL